MKARPLYTGRFVAARRPHVRPAFTLVELLVAIAIVGLLTVGIAQVFSLTGKTVAGGRRLSTLNTFASVIERQLRADIGSITRDGFLLIRHSVVQDSLNPATKDVQLWAGDEASRPSPKGRRADELVLFARGEFQTAREPLNPARVVRSNVARVYYGHGVRGTDATATTPQLDDPATAAATPRGLGERPAGQGQTYANQFAGDWTLLRHVCLLTQPQAGDLKLEPVGTIPTSGVVRDLTWNDSDAQVGLQPAAMSLFRAVPLASTTQLPLSSSLVRGGRSPLFSSGLVDIATTDLSEVRAFVNGVPLTSAVVPPAVITSANIPALDAHGSPSAGFAPVRLGDAGTSNQRSRDGMQAWMREALPANSDAGERMRCEPGAPNFAGAGLSWPATDVEFRRADQLMLAASNFVPHCSEFIVEWSFGQTEPDAAVITPAAIGRVLWHGLERDISVSGKATFDPTLDYRVYPYGEGPGGPRSAPPPPQPTEYAKQVYTLNTGASAQRDIQPKLIHGETLPGNTRIGPLYSYFGYIDPTYTPTPFLYGLVPGGPPAGTIEAAKADFLVDVYPPAGGAFPTYDPLDGDRLVQPDSVEWPWPKLLRITLRLVDPADRSVEQTFQFVLPLPERGGNVE